MFLTVSTLAIFLAIGLLKLFFRKHQSRQARRTLSVQHGCCPPARVPNNKFLGIDRVAELRQADVDSRLMEAMVGHFRQSGNTLEYALFGFKGLATIEPSNIAAMLTNEKDFGIVHRRNALKPIFGDGIFTQDGIAWKHSRVTLRQLFQHKNYSSLDFFRGPVADLIQIMEHEKVVDLQHLFYRMTFDAIITFISEHKVRSLVAEEGSDARKFVDAFDIAQKWASSRMRRWDFRWLGDWRAFRQARNDINKFTDTLIIQDGQWSQQLSSSGGSLLDVLSQETSDPTALRGQILHLLAAGRDTTASLLTWIFFLLVRHPPTLAKLRKEIVIECESNLVLSREKLGRMRFLNNVIKETLRLYPSVPFNFRTATRDTILPHGGGRDEKSPIFVPQGTTVAFFPYALHRRLDIYGLDAEQFRPERWDQDPSLRGFKYASPSFVSFGNGLRTCLGMDFAITEAQYTTVRLLQVFKTIKLPEGEPWEPTGTEKQILEVVMTAGNGCSVATSGGT